MDIKVNTLLHTKDGRKVGNGIVVRTTPCRKEGQAYARVFIKTDYGLSMNLTEDELAEFYYVGEVADATHKHFVSGGYTCEYSVIWVSDQVTEECTIVIKNGFTKEEVLSRFRMVEADVLLTNIWENMRNMLVRK